MTEEPNSHRVLEDSSRERRDSTSFFFSCTVTTQGHTYFCEKDAVVGDADSGEAEEPRLGSRSPAEPLGGGRPQRVEHWGNKQLKNGERKAPQAIRIFWTIMSMASWGQPSYETAVF